MNRIDNKKTTNMSDKKNRFVDALSELKEEKLEESFLSDYQVILDLSDDIDVEVDAIPFPYGGNSEFGKWATQPYSKIR